MINSVALTEEHITGFSYRIFILEPVETGTCCT